MIITCIQPEEISNNRHKWAGDLMPLCGDAPGRFIALHNNKTVEVTVPVGPAFVLVEVSKQDLIDMLAMLPQD